MNKYAIKEMTSTKYNNQPFKNKEAKIKIGWGNYRYEPSEELAKVYSEKQWKENLKLALFFDGEAKGYYQNNEEWELLIDKAILMVFKVIGNVIEIQMNMDVRELKENGEYSTYRFENTTIAKKFEYINEKGMEYFLETNGTSKNDRRISERLSVEGFKRGIQNWTVENFIKTFAQKEIYWVN